MLSFFSFFFVEKETKTNQKKKKNPHKTKQQQQQQKRQLLQYLRPDKIPGCFGFANTLFHKPFYTWHERYFFSYKSFSVCWWWSWRSFLWMDLVSQRRSLRVVTSILLILASPCLLFISIKCLFCCKSGLGFWEKKCPPLPRWNGTFYMSPLCPLLQELDVVK